MTSRRPRRRPRRRRRRRRRPHRHGHRAARRGRPPPSRPPTGVGRNRPRPLRHPPRRPQRLTRQRRRPGRPPLLLGPSRPAHPPTGRVGSRRGDRRGTTWTATCSTWRSVTFRRRRRSTRRCARRPQHRCRRHRCGGSSPRPPPMSIGLDRPTRLSRCRRSSARRLRRRRTGTSRPCPERVRSRPRSWPATPMGWARPHRLGPTTGQYHGHPTPPRGR